MESRYRKLGETGNVILFVDDKAPRNSDGYFVIDRRTGKTQYTNPADPKYEKDIAEILSALPDDDDYYDMPEGDTVPI